MYCWGIQSLTLNGKVLHVEKFIMDIFCVTGSNCFENNQTFIIISDLCNLYFFFFFSRRICYTCQIKVFFMGWFVSKGGGQPCFSKIPNWPSLKLHNFFDFNSNKKSLKIPAKLTNFFHPAKFWNPRPPHRLEISVCPKNFVFPPLGDLPPPPFVFAENDSIQKKIFFLIKVCKCVLQSTDKIMM